jgi:hypothetical protein
MRDPQWCPDMHDLATTAAMVLLPTLPLFFWVRGIVRASKSDLAAGLLLLLIVCAGIRRMALSSSVFNVIGCILIVFGLATLGAWAFAPNNPLFKRQDLVLVAILFLVLGFAGLIML